MGMILAPNKRPLAPNKRVSALARETNRFETRAKTSKTPTIFNGFGKEFVRNIQQIVYMRLNLALFSAGGNDI